MKKTCLLTTIVFLLVAALMGSSSAFAQQASQEKNWQFNLAPFYLWAITIDGDVTQGTATVPVTMPFSDIFDDLESAFIVHFEAMNKNKWGFLVDVNYVDLDGDGTIPQGPGPGIQANVDFKNTIAELSGLYRINRDQHKFDLIAGIRYMELENKVTVVSGPVLADGSKDWVDPLIGARWLWDFADKWKLIARGDIGGFGVGSDFAWQALAAVDWQPFKFVSFIGGYRALGVDYEDGSGRTLFKYDVTLHGPLLGVNFRW